MGNVEPNNSLATLCAKVEFCKHIPDIRIGNADFLTSKDVFNSSTRPRLTYDYVIRWGILPSTTSIPNFFPKKWILWRNREKLNFGGLYPHTKPQKGCCGCFPPLFHYILIQHEVKKNFFHLKRPNSPSYVPRATGLIASSLDNNLPRSLVRFIGPAT